MHAKKQSIASLKDGVRVDDIFVVKIKKGVSRYAKGFSFTLLLTDNSGKTIEYRYWGGPDESLVRKLYDQIPSDSVLLVHGRAARYNNKLQITTNPPDTITVLRPGEYNAADFVPPARKDVGAMFTELQGYISQISSPALAALLRAMFDDRSFREKFTTHPGAIQIHHNWIGGLMEHTLQILAYCRLSWELFPELDRDLLIAGAILHDVGKIDEIEVTSRIKATTEGQLIGHTVLGALGLADKMKTLNSRTRMKLLHMIVSHLGKLEFGAGKVPMFPEAVVLHFADELSSETSAMVEFVKSSREETEDDFMYHRRERTNIFLK